MPMTLYKLDASPPVRAVYMTLRALNIPDSDVEYVDVNLLEGQHLTEDYIKMNPQHTVPTLKDGDFVIWDSHAISTYLINTRSNNHALYPADPRRRAIIDQRLHFDSGILFPALRQTVEPVIIRGEKSLLPGGSDRIKAAYKIADRFLERSPWIAGETMTVADICCVATISTLHEVIPIDKNEFPHLSAWLQRCSQEDFYKKGNLPGLEKFSNLMKSRMS